MDSVNRRKFFLASALLASAACGSHDSVTSPPGNPSSDSTSSDPSPTPSYDLPDSACIVFQGASETDANHSSGTTYPNDAQGLGYGYPLFLAQHLLFKYPPKQLQIYNRARGGDTVPLLQSRWQTDTIDLKPDLLSILIGLNDYADNYGTPNYAATYEANYKALIDTTRQALPDTKIVIIEPYLIYDTEPQDFKDMRAAAARVATYADAIFVSINDMLNQHVNENGHDYWFVNQPNDQHPTIPGSAAIADQWLKTVGL